MQSLSSTICLHSCVPVPGWEAGIGGTLSRGSVSRTQGRSSGEAGEGSGHLRVVGIARLWLFFSRCVCWCSTSARRGVSARTACTQINAEHTVPSRHGLLRELIPGLNWKFYNRCPLSYTRFCSLSYFAPPPPLIAFIHFHSLPSLNHVF